MKSSVKRGLRLIGLAVVALFAGVALTAGNASAVSTSKICYQLTTFTSERISITIKKNNGIASDSGHTQSAYTVDGKWVGTCGGGTAVPVTGSILTSTKGTVKGAHMGLRSQVARISCIPLLVECETTETTPSPGTWFCRLRDESTGFSTATTFNLTPDDPKSANCNVFEAGGSAPAEPPAAEVDTEPASGISQ